jgi:hypothetical protein
MLHRNAEQATEDGPTVCSFGPPILSLPTELSADQKHSLDGLCGSTLRPRLGEGVGRLQ